MEGEGGGEYEFDNMKKPLRDNSLNNNKNDDTAYVQLSDKKTLSEQRRSNSIKILIFITIALLIFLIIFIVLYIAARRKNEDYCQDKECVQIAARIIETMDHSVDPCENFYQYACGSWIKKTAIPDSKRRYSRFEKLAEENGLVLKQIMSNLRSNKINISSPILKRAVAFYNSCINVKEIEEIGDAPMRELIKKLGSWPVTDPTFDDKKWNLMRTITLVHRNISRAPVFNLFVSGDIKRSDVNVLVFDQSGIGMNDRESYLKNTTYHSRRRKAYVKYMSSIVKQLGANETGIELMDKVFQFEKELAKITSTVMERRSYRSIYETMTIKEFAAKTEIPIEWLVEFVESTVLKNKVKLNISERIVSYGTKYIKNAYKLFMKLDTNVQVSYVIWHAVKLMAPLVQGPYQDFVDEYYRTAYGIVSRTPRWEKCIGSTLSAFGDSLSRPFVELVYDKTAKAMSTEMIRAIKAVFASNLRTMDWMDDKTRTYAKFKASRILDNIGYPDKILNETALEEEYKDLQVIESQYFLNVMAQVKFQNFKNYGMYGKPVDKSEWGVLPTAVNAYYAPTKNKIGFPAGILQWPFYDKRAPRAVSYGAIGMVVGHEITHGFDDQGKDFTVEGNYDTWWTNHSLEQFQRKSQCFIDQYSKFSLFDRKMNGRQTLGEDLADNGGLRQALQAYRIWVEKNGTEKKLPGLDLTPEQLYFLAFGQVWCTAYRESAAINQIETGVHSLGMFRVIGPLQNSVDFSKAYSCPVGSKMNPRKKCRIW